MRKKIILLTALWLTIPVLSISQIKADSVFDPKSIRVGVSRTTQPQKFASNIVFVGGNKKSRPTFSAPEKGFIYLIVKVSYKTKVETKFQADEVFLEDGMGEKHLGIPRFYGEYYRLMSGGTVSLKPDMSVNDTLLYTILKAYSQKCIFWFHGKQFVI